MNAPRAQPTNQFNRLLEVPTTLSMIFSVTHYLELHNAIYIYY